MISVDVDWPNLDEDMIIPLYINIWCHDNSIVMSYIMVTTIMCILCRNTK